MSKYRVGDKVVTTHLPTVSLVGWVVDGPHNHNWPSEDNYTVDVPEAGREYVFKESELISLAELQRLIDS